MTQKLSLIIPLISLACGSDLDTQKENSDEPTMQGAALRSGGVLPPNKLHLRPPLGASNIDERLFNQILDNAQTVYGPIVGALGGNLIIDRDWSDTEVNAYASRNGTDWHVQMLGGLARRPEITPDGFALVVGHEIGHHVGGFAFYPGDWAAAEGQADYFSTQVFARKMWALDAAENATYRGKVPASVVDRCDRYWGDKPNRDLCYRIAAAGKSLADLLTQAGSGRTVDFDKPDTSHVTATNPSHPAAQCRLDTYVQGALCNVVFDDTVIPGLNSPLGRASLYAELEAAQYSCLPVSHFLGVPGASDAYRPRCWFKPRLE